MFYTAKGCGLALSMTTLLSSLGEMSGRLPAKDLYACGAGVHVPSIRVNEDGNRRSARHVTASSRSEPPRRRRTVVAGIDGILLRSQVGELRRSLTFTEDVVSSRSPHSVSYRQALRKLGDVFLPTLPPDATHERDRRPRNRRVVVDTKRHLCYLHGPPSVQSSTNNEHYRPSEPALLKSASSSVHHVSSHPSGMLYRKLRTVPVAKSVQWEERLLGGVTSSTAVRLGGGRREEEVEREEEEEVNEAEVEEEDEERREDNYTVCLGKGAKPIWRRGKGDFILLDNNNTFTKVLERRYPQPHSEWCETAEEEEEDKSVVKGARRWTALPHPAPIAEHLQWVCGDRSQTGAGDDRELTGDGKSTPVLRENRLSSQHQHCLILKDWSKRKCIHIQPEDSTEAAVLRNILSLNDSTRAKGMVACGGLAQRKSARELRESGEFGEVVRMLERIVVDQASTGVHVPAAIALHCLGRQSQAAVDSLLEALGKRGTDDVDEWAGLRCLVEGGVCDECVVERCQWFLLNSSDSSIRQSAGNMLARLSDRMPLVHALLAEQLTSRGWQERLLACRVLPSLLCPLSTDVCDHLVVMSWEDWSSAVRDAASQVLAKTGHGKLLHDELVRRLSEGGEVEKLDALKKTSSLRLMTPQLLSVFLPCLSHQHASVRLEAIAICGQLAIRDEAVLQCLVHLLGDPIWSIRAHTLRALRSIGCSDRDVMEQLLWSIRCDKVPAVRAEACHTLSYLWKKGKEDVNREEGERGSKEDGMECRVVSTLRDRLVVEESPMVAEELVGALRRLGGSAEREDPMSSFITAEVRRLGTCGAIRDGVLEGDRQTLTDYIIRRPPTHLTTRDYLTPHQREKYYCQQSAVAKGVESACKRVWSPDRETIGEHLTTIQHLCLSSKPPPQ